MTLVVYAQFVETRDFCWAPHTTQVQFTLQVKINSRRLSEQEVSARYHLYAYGWEAHSPQNLINQIAQYEQTYGRREGARVLLEYRVNGKDRRTWRWPAS